MAFSEMLSACHAKAADWASLPPPQACIDDNPDMVTFLVAHGASINQPDNEGWIPLHAASSCGYLGIAE